MLRFFRHYLHVPAIILAVCEAILLYGLITLFGRTLPSLGGGQELPAVMVTAAAVAGMSAVGLYNRQHFAELRHVLGRAVVALPLVMAAVFAASLVLGGSIWQLAAAGLLAFLPAMLVLREAFVRLVDRFGLFRRRVLLLGAGARVAKIDQLARDLGDRTFQFVAVGHVGSAPATTAVAVDRRQGKRRIDLWIPPADLVRFCRENRVVEVVVAVPERRGFALSELLACRLDGIGVTDYASFWERESGQIDLDEVTPGWLAYADGFATGRLRAAVKRGVDVAVSLAVLLLTLPITAVTALLIKLESPGPVFYLQERVGLHGRTFMIRKFRSMRVDAEKNGPQWAAKGDARVTRVGAVIRKVRIDEIPQVFNVLAGDMSFVGPRPERPVFVEALASRIPYYRERHLVKPGITGWAQINFPYGATEEDARRKLAYDLYYVKNGSLFLDLIIILQTVKVLLWNEGAR
ncbi:MAG: TIGR03013 family XrtA/PEP-CTERM system glycosyltransferase [Solirubrobacterales bacterium]